MPLTITIDDELAATLEAQADARSLSVPEWISMLAKPAPKAWRSWEELNARRIDLIGKKYDAGLNSEESAELETLQDVAAQTCEPTDRARLEHVGKLVEEAKKIASK